MLEIKDKSFKVRQSFEKSLNTALKVDEITNLRLILMGKEEDEGNFDGVDFVGNSLILTAFQEDLRLESGMWVLSTLGGGYSSLGDCGDDNAAKTAMSISETQFKLALKMNDDFMAARTILYYGTAMTQLNEFEKAVQALWLVFIFSIQSNSQKLFDMCAALYIKICAFSLSNQDFQQNQKYVLMEKLFENPPTKKWPNTLTAIRISQRSGEK